MIEEKQVNDTMPQLKQAYITFENIVHDQTSQQHAADDYAYRLAICHREVQLSSIFVTSLSITLFTFLHRKI